MDSKSSPALRYTFDFLLHRCTHFSCIGKRTSSGTLTKSTKSSTMVHKLCFVECISCVLYEIPFSCGNVYIGQTGRCLNDRLREHHSSLKATPSGQLALQVVDCRCHPIVYDRRALDRLHKTARVYGRSFHHAQGPAISCQFNFARSPQ